MLDGKPKYVTAVARRTLPTAGTAGRFRRGCIIDVETDRVVTDHLSMPHSPRVGPDGKLYAVDSGRGFLVEVDKETGNCGTSPFARASFAGWPRSMAHALVTVSKPRYGKFEACRSPTRWRSANQDPECAVLVIDLARGEIVEWLRLEGDVAGALHRRADAGIKCPMVVGPHDRRFADTITFDAGDPAARRLSPDSVAGAGPANGIPVTSWSCCINATDRLPNF